MDHPADRGVSCLALLANKEVNDISSVRSAHWICHSVVPRQTWERENGCFYPKCGHLMSQFPLHIPKYYTVNYNNKVFVYFLTPYFWLPRAAGGLLRLDGELHSSGRLFTPGSGTQCTHSHKQLSGPAVTPSY